LAITHSFGHPATILHNTPPHSFGHHSQFWPSCYNLTQHTPSQLWPPITLLAILLQSHTNTPSQFWPSLTLLAILLQSHTTHPLLLCCYQGERSTSANTFGAAVGLWRNLSNRLFDLEAGIVTAASATQKQTTTVKNIRKQVLCCAVCCVLCVCV